MYKCISKIQKRKTSARGTARDRGCLSLRHKQKGKCLHSAPVPTAPSHSYGLR